MDIDADFTFDPEPAQNQTPTSPGRWERCKETIRPSTGKAEAVASGQNPDSIPFRLRDIRLQVPRGEPLDKEGFACTGDNERQDRLSAYWAGWGRARLRS